MRKKNKILFVSILGFCLLMAAVWIAYNITSPQEAANQKKPGTGASDTVLAKKQAAKLPNSKPQNSTVLSSSTKATNLKSSSYVFYPDALLDLLGIDKDWLAENSTKFITSDIHTDWMGRIDAILKDIDPAKKDAMAQNQTALLAIKEALNAAYLSGQLDWETFRSSVAELLKWHQETYAAILSPTEYEALFEFKPEEASNIIDAMVQEAPQYGFILNQKLPVQEVTRQVQAHKLEEVNAQFNKMVLDKDQIAKWIESGELTLEEAREALSFSQQEFIAKCKEILTLEEINLIFGSMENLESGSTQTEPPTVLGTADIDQLGFKIENPQTSVDMVTEKIAQDKIEDLNFLYEKANHEKEILISQLDAGDVKPDQIENLFGEIDAAYVENCRKILTEEEFNLIFEDPSELKP